MANEDFFYISENENCTIVWQGCVKNSSCAKRFYVPNYEGVLPFFISGVGDEALDYAKTVGFKEVDLMKGILYGLYEFDHQTKPWHQEKDRETLLYLLDIFEKGFKYKNQEAMILNVSANVRKESGNATSRIVLEVGNILVPQSSKIKSDLIFDLWEVICKKEESNKLFKEVINLIYQIDLLEINSMAKEIICFYGLCALVFLRQLGSIDSYLQKYIYPNVKMKELTDAIDALLRTPNNFIPEDLRVAAPQ